MATLGMDPQEIKSLFKTVAGILHFGNIEVKQRPREEWATIPTTTGEKPSKFTKCFPVVVKKNMITKI